MFFKSSLALDSGVAPHGWPGGRGASIAGGGRGLTDCIGMSRPVSNPPGDVRLCVPFEAQGSGDPSGVSIWDSSAERFVNCGGLIFSSGPSSASPSDISNIRSWTELLPFSAGVGPGLLVSFDTLLLVLCRRGDAETSSKLCALNDDDKPSTSAYLFDSTIASTFARFERSIFSASSGYRSKSRASAWPLLAKGRYAS
jgi:hypothetical protein